MSYIQTNSAERHSRVSHVIETELENNNNNNEEQNSPVK